MLAAYETQGSKMSVKFHSLYSYTNHIPVILGVCNEEQSKKIYQAVSDIERRHQEN